MVGSTSCHKALTLTVDEHLGTVRRVAVLMVCFVNVGGSQCASA